MPATDYYVRPVQSSPLLGKELFANRRKIGERASLMTFESKPILKILEEMKKTIWKNNNNSVS